MSIDLGESRKVTTRTSVGTSAHITIRASTVAIALLLCGVITFAHLPSSHAWGKRGHAVVCEIAASLASRESKGDFLRSHSFDLGYYCNVPDIIWKKPATYKIESSNHFMDMEIFERALKESKTANPYELSRSKFNQQFPEIKDEAGRAWWRVTELNSELTKISDQLKALSADSKAETGKSEEAARVERHLAQANWLVHAGAIGHYIGDLSQPLHVSENYDGQLSEQKGIHAFYEDKIVDELFSDLASTFLDDVNKAARLKWKKQSQQLARLSIAELLKKQTTESTQALAKLLKTDKSTGRKSLAKAVQAHRPQIIERLASGAVILAEIYRRQLGWQYDGKRFYNFVAEPEYISPYISPPSEASAEAAPSL